MSAEVTADVAEVQELLSELDVAGIVEHSVKTSGTPTLRIADTYMSTYGPIASDFAAKHGLVLDPWQRAVLDDVLAVRRNDEGALVYQHRNAGLSIPRQNGKTAIIEAIELFCAAILGEKILHTSHEVKTTGVAFDRIVGFFSNPDFEALYQLKKSIHRAPGQQRIKLHNGGEIRFISREKNSGRGFTVDRIVFDEAMDIQEAAIATLIPTTASGGNRNSSFLYAGTPPGPSHQGEAFRRIRERALKREPGVCWNEWGAETEGLNIDDVLQWGRLNPSVASGRYQVDVIAAARVSMDEEQFSRELLGVWGKATSQAPVDEVSWQRVLDAGSKMVSRRCLAVDVAPDRAHASVSVAGLREDGKRHIELVETRAGVGWLVPFLVDLIESREEGWFSGVIVDQYGPAANLIPDLKRAGVRVTEVGLKELIAATQDFYDGVMGRQVFHIGQTQLSASLGMSRKHVIAERGWKISRSSGDANVTPITSAVLALYGASSDLKLRRPKRRETAPAAPTGVTGQGSGFVIGW